MWTSVCSTSSEHIHQSVVKQRARKQQIIIIIIFIIHEFHGDTSLKQNFRAAVNVTYKASVNAAVATNVRCRTICETVPSSMHA